MRRLILKGLVLGLAVVVSCVALLAVMPRPHNTYFLGAMDKWRAAEESEPPRILIVGGSNTAFGFDSRTLHDSLGVPIVNFGLNAGLGLRYMLNEVAAFMGEGDIVVVSPEYEQFYGDTFWGARQLVEVAWVHPPALRHMLSLKQFRGMARGFPTVFQERIRTMWLDFRTPGREVGHDIYSRDAFNEFGDVVSHVDAHRGRPIEEMPILRDTTASFNPAAIRALDRFHETARERGARVFVLFPTIPTYHYDLRRDEIETAHRRLRDESTVPVLAPPTTQVGPADHFFDTAYHLSGKGRAAQTARLLELLRAEGVARRGSR